MLKILNCVNCVTINKFTGIYPSETSGEFLFNFCLGNIPKNGAKEDPPRIEPLTSRFPLNDLELYFFALKFQIKLNKQFKRYIMLMHTIVSYYNRCLCVRHDEVNLYGVTFVYCGNNKE
jgi:hypothetical protein